MRETFFFPGKRKRAQSVEDVTTAVRALYPKAIAQGSTCHWSWIVEGKIVAESWMSNDMRWWYYKIATDGGLSTEG